MATVDYVQVEMFTPVQNNAILRLPGRRYPGVLIQGDSLSDLLKQSKAVLRIVESVGNPILLEKTADLHKDLQDLQRRYEKVLLEHGMKLPYSNDE